MSIIQALRQLQDKHHHLPDEELKALAVRLGVPRARVAVIGDWLNDLGMFKYAGRSFAMGQAPSIVRDAATDIVRSTSATGGGVAEAIAALVASLGPQSRI